MQFQPLHSHVLVDKLDDADTAATSGGIVLAQNLPYFRGTVIRVGIKDRLTNNTVTDFTVSKGDVVYVPKNGIYCTVYEDGKWLAVVNEDNIFGKEIPSNAIVSEPSPQLID